MTFADFQTTRTWRDDIGKVLPDYTNGAEIKGNIYADELVIEECNHAKGRWYLLIANTDWISDDLETLERRLYDYALDEQIVDAADGPDTQSFNDWMNNRCTKLASDLDLIA